LAAALFAAWIRQPAMGWALAGGAAALAAAASGARRRPAAAAVVAAVGLVGAILLARTSARVTNVEQTWEADSTGVRWQMVEVAGQRLNQALAAAVEQVRDLADRSADLADRDRSTAFARAAALLGDDGPERGLVVFDQDGRPWAWAGRHRIPPATDLGLQARITPFYVVLVAGRQGARGGFASAHVVLSADAAVPDGDGTLGARFAQETGVGLRFYPPGRGPYFADVFDYCVPACATANPDTLFSVRLDPPAQGSYKLGLLDRGGRWAAGISLALLLTVVLFGRVVGRTAAIGLGAAVLILTPAGRFIPIDHLFSPATFYAEAFGPGSASAGALLAASVLAFVLGGWLWRSGWPARRVWVVGAALALAAPLVLGRLAAGITPPAEGADLGLSVQWQVLLTVASAALLVTAAALVKRSFASEGPWWVSALAAVWAAGAALAGAVVWAPEVGWPGWYLNLWLPAVALALVPAPRARALATVAVVAGTAAAVLTWGAVADGRILLAARDVAGVRQGGDAIAVGLLERFGATLQRDSAPRSAAELYARWRPSALEADRYPAVLAVWAPGVSPVTDQPRARLALAALDLPDSALRDAALPVVDELVPVVRTIPGIPGTTYVLAVPFPDGSVVTVGLGPRTRLLTAARVARFLRGERTLPPPFALSLSDPLAPEDPVPPPELVWRRDGWAARGEVRLTLADGHRHLHATVPLGSLSGVVVRGLLLIVVDLAVLGFLWFAAEAVAGRLTVPPVVRELVTRRSYRARLGLAFAVFFVVPTVGFAAWTATRLTGETRRTRDVMIRQTLADATGTAREFLTFPDILAREMLADLAGRLDAALVLYDDGALRQSSDPVLAELGVLDWFLTPPVERALTAGDELDLTLDQRVGGRPVRVGYRRIAGGRDQPVVLGAPRLVDDPDLLRNEQDLVFGLILVTLTGLAAAAGLTSLAARSLAKPVEALRRAAEAVRRGALPLPFGPDAPGEFAPVMAAFERMASDVHASRAALEAQRQRTAAVLRNVATGVLALDDGFRVVTSNPRAEDALGCDLAPGTHVDECTGEEWQPVWTWLRAVARGQEGSEPREFALGERQVRVQMARLSGAASGWVVALDDVTDLARAVRVLAWGELARQIAHEIKNPLTPIRLGVQHLRRAYEAPRSDYAETLDRTSRQILAEIERLDAIARAFSRFGAPPSGAEPLGAVDAVDVARDTAALYALAEGGAVRVVADGPIRAQARRDELKEVLINLVENARQAQAHIIAIEVTRMADGAAIVVRDDGTGIAADDLPRVFEPRFSTTTSGTGLGLAICKRLVESWGGRLAVESPRGEGTTVRLTLTGAT
jgi:signal transduction histidine kinase